MIAHSIRVAQRELILIVERQRVTLGEFEVGIHFQCLHIRISVPSRLAAPTETGGGHAVRRGDAVLPRLCPCLYAGEVERAGRECGLGGGDQDVSVLLLHRCVAIEPGGAVRIFANSASSADVHVRWRGIRACVRRGCWVFVGRHWLAEHIADRLALRAGVRSEAGCLRVEEAGQPLKEYVQPVWMACSQRSF